MKRAALSTLALLAVGLLATDPALAQSGRGDGAFQLRVGGFFPSGEGEFWEDTEQIFTIDSSDFDSGVLGLSYVAGMTNFVELGLNADFYEKTVLSAERDFTDEFGDEVLHDTTLSQIPVSVDLRLLPLGRYKHRHRGGGVLQPVIYVGGGIGVSFFEYEEIGDFVGDFGNGPEVFFDRFRDSGSAFSTHVVGGLEFPVSPQFNLMFEARHTWADAELSDDFGGQEIELGGTAAYVGGSFRF